MHWDLPMVVWGSAALALFALEALVPGAFMLWLGLAAAVVFVLVLVFDLTVLAQITLFVGLSFASILVYRRWFRRAPQASDQPTLNRRADALVGRVVPLERAIVAGHGRVQIADAYWDVTGPELPAGAPVRIVAARGMTLVVDPA
ncbi:NfeD family protein [Agrilutibacter solisilvae]|uniref:NfeD family protein n=1 Tax=Agrilutibacter solisilvae TaxID=2763317 RepID=A0A975AU42_9GAMM|nr:NfeD family protein [Lysobacter solisilvae]QSX79765.1 NfeD family protein [Lysobacter solisilvae]